MTWNNFAKGLLLTGWSLVILLWVVFGIVAVRFVDFPPYQYQESRRYVEVLTTKKNESTDSQFAAPGAASEQESDREPQKSDSLEVVSTKSIGDPALRAQEGLWRAAVVLVILTVFQVLASAYGIWLLIRNLAATSKAVEAVNRTASAAENAERAHVFVEYDYEFAGPNEPGNMRKSAFRVTPKIVNHGRSPATILKYTIEPKNTEGKSLDKRSGEYDSTISKTNVILGVSKSITVNEAARNLRTLEHFLTENLNTDSIGHETVEYKPIPDVGHGIVTYECTVDYRDIFGARHSFSSDTHFKPVGAIQHIRNDVDAAQRSFSDEITRHISSIEVVTKVTNKPRLTNPTSLLAS